MNYVLQVIRGRSDTTTLKLLDGVTSLGRHDDCVIRIKSSQVSRRHCEIFEVGDKLMVRDLGSSNGTFVNGKRVLGQQAVKAGDELTIGGITLRVATLGPAAVGAGKPESQRKPGDTAVVDAVPLDDEEEFEIELDHGDAPTQIESIPLAGTTPAQPAVAKPATERKKSAEPPEEKAAPATKSKSEEDDAVAQFLLDLKLEDEE